MTFDPASSEIQSVRAIEGATKLVAVACPTLAQCTAVDASGLGATFDPSSPAPAISARLGNGSSGPFVSIACMSQTACVALAQEAIEGDPQEGDWRRQFINLIRPSALTCVPNTGCVAVGEVGLETLGIPEASTNAPAVTAMPMIPGSGHPREGETLTASAGAWTNSPTTFSYTWEDCNIDGLRCTPIVGAGGSSYTLAASDVEHTIRVRVRAANTEGAGSEVSAPTELVFDRPPPLGPSAPYRLESKLSVSLSPDRYGARTSLHFTIELAGGEGTTPPPLTGFQLYLPAALRYTALRPAQPTCEPAALEERHCSQGSQIGSGMMFWQTPFGGYPSSRELPAIEVFAGPPQDGRPGLIAYISGQEPVYAQVLATGALAPASSPFGSELDFAMPLIPAVPDGPDVSTTKATITLDTSKLTYTRRVHGKRMRLHRSGGFSLANSCPRGDLRFFASFSFKDSPSGHASVSVPCPRRTRDSRR